MELVVFKRTKDKKSDIKNIRRRENIPCVVNAMDGSSENIYVEGSEFLAILRKIDQTEIPTTIFMLKSDKSFKAIIKEMQYEKTTYKLIHIVFLKLEEDKKVTINVPIKLLGKEVCSGVKLGGALRQVIRCLNVRCLPKDIPSSFSLDVADLKISQTKKLKDIKIGDNIEPRRKLDEVCVIVAKR